MSLVHFLPLELLPFIFRCLDVVDLASLMSTCSVLRSGAEAEAALKRRAEERGSLLPDSLPAGVRGWADLLLRREWLGFGASQPVAAGWCHSVYVNAQGQLYSCGDERLGLELNTDEEDVEDIGAGLLGHIGGSMLLEPITVLKPTLLTYIVGVDPYEEEENKHFKSVAASGEYSVALTASGKVYSWGGEVLGTGHGDERAPCFPALVPHLLTVRVCCISAGFGHAAALTDHHHLFTWGSGPGLGHGATEADVQFEGHPRRVEALAGVCLSSLAAGWEYTLTSSLHGDVYSFGRGNYGQLGHGDDHEDRLLPSRMEDLSAAQGTAARAVSAGKTYSLALTAAGIVYEWGDYDAVFGDAQDADDFQGEEKRSPLSRPDELLMPGRARVVRISAGNFYGCAVTATGHLFTWGKNAFLGHGRARASHYPARVQALRNVKVVAVSASPGFRNALTLVVAEDGSVFSIGPLGGPRLVVEEGILGAAPHAPQAGTIAAYKPWRVPDVRVLLAP